MVTINEFARKLKEKLSLSSIKEARRLIYGMASVLSDIMKSEECIILPGFCRFDVMTLLPRKCRNPSTGDIMEVSEMKMVRFKALTPIKKLLNKVISI